MANEQNNKNNQGKGGTLLRVLSSDRLKSLGDAAVDSITKSSKNPEKAKQIFGSVQKLLGVAAPALGFIPGVGPILSKVAQTVSTLNDDEWFGKYTTSGATFNELLQLTSEELRTDVIPFLGTYTTDINFSNTVKDTIFPSMLADIREKTNNVLVDDVDKYWHAFCVASQLYAIYYTGLKYIKLATDIPTNTPFLPDKIAAIKPRTINQFVGIINNLGDYLKSTVSLPYAWVSYLRWRYGSAFLSEQSDRAGLIMYDYAEDLEAPAGTKLDFWVVNHEDFIDKLEALISSKRQALSQTGRACADIRIAYKAHMIKYDVEVRHYDAKEFNLRCNLTLPLSVQMEREKARILLSSHLNQGPAIQAVTLSTWIGDFDEIIRFTDHTDQAEVNEKYGAVVFPVINSLILVNVPSTSTENLPSLLNPTINGTKVTIDQLTEEASHGGWFNGTYYLTMIDKMYSDDNIAKYKFEGVGELALDHVDVADAKAYVMIELYRLAAIALQMHYNDVCHLYLDSTTGAPKLNAINSAPLSYDMAIINRSQLDAIHRTALRNLVRIDYTRKSSDVAERKEAVKEVMETMTDADKKVIEVK